jgi:hypothetical protein
MASRIEVTDVDVSDSEATQLFAASAQRRTAFVANKGPNPIYVGPSDVTAATGFPIPEEDANGVPGYLSPLYYSVGDQSVCEALYAIADTADQTGTANTRVFATYAA